MFFTFLSFKNRKHCFTTSLNVCLSNSQKTFLFFLLQRERARRRQDVVHPIQLMPLNQELAFVTCAVVLLILISRIIFSQDPFQV